MSKETERIMNRLKTEQLRRLETEKIGGEIVKKRADEYQEDFNSKDMGDSKFRIKRFLKSLLPKVSLKNEVDPEKYNDPYILYPGSDEAFLVLERKLISNKRPDNESTKGLPSNYEYTGVMALGYKKEEDKFIVGFFGKNENDIYLANHPEERDFKPVNNIGMLFTKTVPEEEIIPTLALAMASYEYNNGKRPDDQITFPGRI